MAPQEILGFAKRVADQVRHVRLKYAGRDYSSAQKELSAHIRALQLDVKTPKTFLKKTPLSE